MFTVCPKCSLKLVVTAADLRVAQGYVRCGRCTNVFNALVGLSDEQQAVLAQEERASARNEQPAALPAAPAGPRAEPVGPRDASAGPRDAPTGPPARADEPISDAALEFDPVATDVSEVFVEPTLEEDGSTGRSENIILRSEEDERPEDPQPATAHQTEAPAGDSRDEGSVPIELDSVEFEKTDEFELADLEPLLDVSGARPGSPGALTQAPGPPASGASSGSQVSVVSIVSSAPPADGARVEQAAQAVEVADVRSADVRATDRTAVLPAARSAADSELDSRETPVPAARRFDALAAVGSVVLALVLAAQIVHHYRARLADIEWLRPSLTAVYAALGMPLVPHWDVGAYEVRQLGAIVGPENPGALTVRASIKNTAAMRQPLPLLRVTVQDRFGNRVAARDVPPRAYLPSASAQREYLAAGQRVDAEIALVDPGPTVVGFEIDACLEDAAGRVSCANEASDSSRLR